MVVKVWKVDKWTSESGKWKSRKWKVERNDYESGGMVMKPARLPCCKFLLALGPDRAQRSKAFLSFWSYWQIETSHWFIQPQFVNEKQRSGLCTVRELNLTAPLHKTWCLPAFINQPPLLTMPGLVFSSFLCSEYPSISARVWYEAFYQKGESNLIDR